MIDVSKVHMMTKLAVYEEGEGKKELRMHRYSPRTYLSLKLLGSFFLGTIAYLCGAGMYMMRYYSNIMTEGLAFSYRNILINILVVYVIVMAVNLIATFVIQRRRYLRMLRHVGQYDRNLSALKKYLEKEEQLQ
ncbi:MAG TPA: hypothetical protein H9880_09040 [Candidatus Anaerobutyricum avicola]|nr:hypothetical protein [Candidatus Anaerobutyricum avicola]